jgi:hypothetical protein
LADNDSYRDAATLSELAVNRSPGHSQVTQLIGRFNLYRTAATHQKILRQTGAKALRLD